MPPLRSRTVTHGRNMAGARALLRATGVAREDLGKPIIAVANSFTEFVPGHVHLREVGQVVADAVRAAGAIPREFNTIAVDDGIASVARNAICTPAGNCTWTALVNDSPVVPLPSWPLLPWPHDHTVPLLSSAYWVELELPTWTTGSGSLIAAGLSCLSPSWPILEPKYQPQ